MLWTAEVMEQLIQDQALYIIAFVITVFLSCWMSNLQSHVFTFEVLSVTFSLLCATNTFGPIIWVDEIISHIRRLFPVLNTFTARVSCRGFGQQFLIMEPSPESILSQSLLRFRAFVCSACYQTPLLSVISYYTLKRSRTTKDEVILKLPVTISTFSLFSLYKNIKYSPFTLAS